MVGRKFGFLLLVFSQVFVFTLVSVTSSFSQRKLSATSQRQLSPETVYSNSTPITINTVNTFTPPSTAIPYPSQITVSGMTGTVTRLAVVLRGLDHLASADLDFLLVGPGGEKFIFLSDAVRSAGGPPMNDEFYTIADDAPFTFPTPPQAEDLHFYKPTSGDATTDTFPAPAPAGPYGQPPTATFASVYNGINPNGVWSLYVADDNNNPALLSASSGKLNTGWALTITTSGSPTTFANYATVAMQDIVAPSSPYGSPINVTGASGVLTNLKVTLTGLSHARPRDIDILLVTPDGRSFILMSDAGGTSAASNINLTFDDAAANIMNANSIASGTFKPTDFNISTDTWLAPTPFGPRFNFQNSNTLSVLYGDNPNGEWNLYIVDSVLANSGSLSGGWSLDITTALPAPPPAPTCLSPGFAVSNYGAGTNPTNLAIADYNNDTKPDVAVVNQDSNNVSILLGNGNGTFGAQSTVSAGSSPYSIAAGKFNADSNFDLAVTNTSANTVSILLGNGNGTFGSPTTFPVGLDPISVATGDFNGDLKADLAVANFGGFFTGSVSLLLGNGSGGFTSGGQIRTRTQPAYVAVGDLNLDTKTDLVVASFGSDSVSTFIGNGTGAFLLGQNLTSSIFGPVSISIGDVTGGGTQDILIANYNADTVTSCDYDGVGFYTCHPIPAGQNPISVVTEDFTGDGLKEPGIALSGSNSVRVLASSANVGSSPNAIASADLNNDGKPDLISANSGSNDISVLLTSCSVARGNIFDFNGDRRTDYIVWRPASANWYDYTISQGPVTYTLGYPTDKLVPADYNGDGFTDFGIYRPENGLWITRRINNTSIHHLNFGLAEDIPVPADFDGDGKVDIAVWRPSEGNWYIRQSTDHALLAIHWGTTGDLPAPSDFDGDQKADITVFRPSDGVWYTLRSTDSGFQAIQFGASGDRPVPGDYDGDGKADQAVFRPSEGVWYVFKSSDNGFFGVPWGVSTDIPVPGDYEGDGKFDFAVRRSSDFTFYVLKSSDQTPIYITWGQSTDYPVASAFVP